MYEATVTLRQGEIRPLYAQATATQGDTLTFQAAPSAPYTAPTFALLDNTGTPVSGFDSVAIGTANYQGTALASPLLWFTLNTSGLNPGAYVARFLFAVRSTSDGLIRELACEVRITLLAKVEVTATYDVATPAGQTRLYCLDNDMTQAVFSDAEINQFVLDAGGIPILAAALALDALATDRARLATVLKIGTFGNSEVGVYQALVERATRLRSLAPALPIVASPAPVFACQETW